MAFAEVAVISKSEISGHRSAQTQVELDVSKKVSPIVAAIRALLTSKVKTITMAKVKMPPNIRRRLHAYPYVIPYKLQLRSYGWNDHLKMRCQPGRHARVGWGGWLLQAT